ncbi:hypothetical protein [Variovorax sp. KK3]|uniref:hypothetical protein n=1 Tax=Variovorax sp. KK3 TaxID=1855728 RepID=UPI00117F05A0|nr:hypothetical protein [Variovorax sp. KK3]
MPIKVAASVQSSHIAGPLPASRDLLTGARDVFKKACALLHRLSKEAFPCTLDADEDFAPSAVLVHAGHIRAQMELVPSEWGGLPEPAVVVGEITQAGWNFLSLGHACEPPQFPMTVQEAGRAPESS